MRSYEGRGEFNTRRARPDEGGGYQNEQRPAHYVARCAEWLVSCSSVWQSFCERVATCA